MTPPEDDNHSLALEALRSYILSRLDGFHDLLINETVRNEATRKDDIGRQMKWVQVELDSIREDIRGRMIDVQSDVNGVVSRFDSMENSINTKMEELSSRSMKNIIAVQAAAILIIIGVAITLMEMLINR